MLSPKLLAPCLAQGLAASQPRACSIPARHRHLPELCLLGKALCVTAAPDVRPGRLSPVVRSRAEFFHHISAIQEAKGHKSRLEGKAACSSVGFQSCFKRRSWMEGPSLQENVCPREPWAFLGKTEDLRQLKYRV